SHLGVGAARMSACATFHPHAAEVFDRGGKPAFELCLTAGWKAAVPPKRKLPARPAQRKPYDARGEKLPRGVLRRGRHAPRARAAGEICHQLARAHNLFLLSLSDI